MAPGGSPALDLTVADQLPQSFIRSYNICVLRVHRLPSSVLKFFPCGVASGSLRVCKRSQGGRRVSNRGEGTLQIGMRTVSLRRPMKGLCLCGPSSA